ncbi:MAG: T9SS type A sorting domain-containing protein [Bacteroidales bacterium]|nr:T9SS type A sorting domain-containing protein [Bacteroidales bacterium]
MVKRRQGIYKLTAAVLFVLTSVAGQAQIVYESGTPAGIAGIDIESFISELNISEQSIDSVKNIYATGEKRFRFAVQRECNLKRSNSGVVKKNGKGIIWYLPVRSRGAESLNVIFSGFRLEEGEQLFVYDREQTTVRGPFTWRNNNDNNILAIMPVPGDEMIIELQLIEGSSSEPVASRISHDFLGILQKGGAKDYYFGGSGPCNIDINCSEGDDWQVEKRSVVRILVAGNELGTGVLVNNSNQENIPYILTAEHLVNNQVMAEASLFVFGYESPWCDGPDGVVDMSLSGADLIATNAEVDMTLLRLSSFPPVTYKPYLAGWDATGTIHTGSVTIHHPGADVKKITIDLQQPIISTFEGMRTDAFWQILEWEYGTTEGGSSGAPLFNQDRRVVGSLTGGEAVCGRSVNDYFYRFDVAWDVTDYMFMSLRAWLDPARSGSLVLDGRDPYAPNFEAGDTTGLAAGSQDLLTLYSQSDDKYTTGLNSDSIIAYAEFMPYAGNGFVTELYAKVGKVSWISASDSVTFFVASGDGEVPGSVIAAKRVLIGRSRDDFLLSVTFDYPVPVTGNFFAGYRLWYKSLLSSDQPQFALYHSQILPEEENRAWFLNGTGWYPFTMHPEDPAARSLALAAIVIADPVVNSVEYMKEERSMDIYPNPASERVTLLLRDIYPEEYIVSLSDITGRILYRSGRLMEREHIIRNLDSFNPGIYIIRIDYRGGYETRKLVVGGRR